MNKRQRRKKLERAHKHQARPKERTEGKVATAPPPKPRKRVITKRLVRKMGRKVRPS